MVVGESNLQQIEQSILDIVGSAGMTSPGRLIDDLRRRGFSEELIRAAMWFLIDEERLSLTRERMLRLPDSQPGSANGHRASEGHG